MNTSGSIMRTAAVILFALTGAAIAASSHGGEHWFRQPDGSKVRVIVWGDEFYQDVESPDGYTLVRGAGGWICYAKLADGGREYVSTGVRYAGNSRAPDVRKGVRINRDVVREKVRGGREALGHGRLIEERQREWEGQRRSQGQSQIQRQGQQGRQGQQFLPDGISSASAASVTKTIVGLTLMVQFSDEKFHPNITKAMAEEFCNREGGVNGNSPAGSVRDYFLDVSNGLLDYSNIVAPVITLDNDKLYYDTETGGRNEFITDALNKLKEMDFSLSGVTVNYNEAAALNILYVGSPSWGWGKGLWPHAGTYGDFDAVTVDGVKFSGYQVTNMGSADAMPGIGLFVHENGHLLMGWPDLYSYTGHSNGLGSWCVMSAQDNNNPQQPNPYLRDLAGWITATDITAYALENTLSHTANGPSAYVYRRDKQSHSSEVYYIEARRKTGPRNSALPGSGLAIWHVHTGGSNAHQHNGFPLVALVQADGRKDLENLINKGDDTDLFRAGLNAEFNGKTSPASVYHDGRGSGLSLSGISDSGAVMTFKFKVDIGDISGFYERIAAYAAVEEDVVVEVGEYFILDRLVNIPAPAVAGKTLTIRRNRASAAYSYLERKRGLMGNLFIVPAGAVLILEDVIISGDARLPGFPISLPCGGALVMVDEGGKLVMNDGAVLCDNNTNTRDGAGGGVFVSGEFIMNGGIIIENAATRPLDGGPAAGTGDGGGVYVSNGVFTMNGGQISGNKAHNGGGVYVSSGVFTMNGGQIIDNTASSGGGVFITGSESAAASKFTMTNGEISVNIAGPGSNIGIAGNAAVSLYGGTVTGAAAFGAISVILDKHEFQAPNRQWYSNTSASNTGGTAITGAAGMSYNVSTSAAGTFYYYVEYGEAGQFLKSAATTITIGGTTSVLTPGRVIPQVKPNADAAAAVPAPILSAEFTAGPNPIRRGGSLPPAVNFFRQGRRVDSCELRIYDAQGNFINKITINDRRGGPMWPPLHSPNAPAQPRRHVGAWDLRDDKGRIVGDGTYVVKGVLRTSDGKSEKISLMIGVR